MDDTLATLAERLKQFRRNSQLTLEQLAQHSGVSRSMLSQIERGKANPTLAIACRIAKALNISIVELVEEPWTQPDIEVVKATDKQAVLRDDENGYVRMLTPNRPERVTEFYKLTLPIDGELNSSPHFRGTKEVLTVHAGEVVVLSGQDSAVLKAGDTAHYLADQPHRIINRGNSEALLYMVMCLEEPNAIGYEWDMDEA